MGSFHTSCMVTGIEISGEEQAIFLPFKQNHASYKEKKKVDFEATAQSFLNEDFYLFSPYLLPIKGDYDTYGNLENIERDANVEYIERHFGMEIESFMDIVTCSREFGSSLSELSSHFLSKEAMEKQKTYASFSEVLQALGFDIEEVGEVFIARHPKCSFFIRFNGAENTGRSSASVYTVQYKDGTEERFRDNYNHDLFATAIREDNYFLGVKASKQKIVGELYGLSGAFIQPKVYERLSTFTSNDVKNLNTLDLKEMDKFYRKGDSEVFAPALHSFSLFVKNLRNSNRIFQISKSMSEQYSLEPIAFHSGLLEVIQQEINKIDTIQGS